MPSPKVYLKVGCTTVAVTSIAWVFSQIKGTKNILNNAVDLSMLNLLESKKESIPITPIINLEPEYITLNHLKIDKRPRFLLWESLKFMLAQRLIGLSHSENDFVRMKALDTLAKLQNFNQGHYSLLANMIDKHAAIQLARIKNVNMKLFIEPPLKYLKYTERMIVNEIKELLFNLSDMCTHKCLEQLISKAFFSVEETSRLVDNDSIPMEMVKLGENEQNVLPICLEALLHHASIETFGKDVVKMNALPLLSEIHSRYRGDLNINVALSKIISYLSFHKEIIDELYRTGWIGILAEWMKHEDVRISIPAARALANLENKEELYKRHLYLLHPSYAGCKEPKVDVVFVHGLLGGVFFTWRQRTKTDLTIGLMESLSQTLFMPGIRKKSKKTIESSEPRTMQYIRDFEEEDMNEARDFEVVLDDIPTAGDCAANCAYTCGGDKLAAAGNADNFTYCWPRDWLGDDCRDLRVLGVNYETTLSKWNGCCSHVTEKTNLEEQSAKLMASLLQAGVGKRPVVWVTHSMGGLLVKNILCKASGSSDPGVRRLIDNTRGIVFYSTPHLGSNLATFNPASQLVLRLSIEVQDLRENSPLLLDIHKRFLKVLEDSPIRVISFVESKKTYFTALKFNFQLVTPESGNPGVGEYYEIPLDHLGICKPMSKFSFLYRRVYDFVQEVIEST
ncbi:protein SERAC1 isoform X2 [Coccinella septempunctata]|uniref:protein SERAC1 isoform X2 n=1 Tax=Coccinella septempunctata TaxID=41139 RepID=UPI001D097D0D|nr:protein SERAC1 isoform X2 [Coccinella septempunctata]